MAGLNHDFLLLSRQDYSESDYNSLINDPRAMQIHDDVVRYIGDSLTWIPTYNPAKKQEGFGLCLYGPTVIRMKGSAQASAIFSAWTNLFLLGTPSLTLTGAWTEIEGKSETGNYEKIILQRDELVDKLQTIGKYAKQVEESNDNYFLLHLGI
ncbi:MAG: hypothetical protein AAF821_25955 [Cyanobacteria bacterium P01_D01_bin.156]